MFHFSLPTTQARLPDGQIYRPISSLLRQLDLDMSLVGSQGLGVTDGEDGQISDRKPAHALLHDEEQDEIPVHGPDGK